jgi:ABC transporter substrate binding protein
MDANADTVGDRMERREFMRLLSGTAVLWPFAARAQQADRVRRIAWLGLGRADEPSPFLDSLRAGLSELGWIEGRNLTIGLFWATGREDMEGAARELLASDPEVIVTQELMAIAMRSLQTAKPVVFGFSGDPVDGKLAQSWAKPGGNFTGISYLAIELVGKRIELLKEWLPQTRRIAVLARPQHPGEHLERQATEAVVGKLGIELSYFPYQSQSFLPARDLGELESVFRAVVQDQLRRTRSLPGFRDVRSLRPRCSVRVGSQTALCLRLVFIRPEGITDDIWAERARALSIARALHRPHSAWHQARRSADRGADQILSGDKSEDGQGARPRNPTDAARAR